MKILPSWSQTDFGDSIIGLTSRILRLQTDEIFFQISILAIEIQHWCGLSLERSACSCGVQWFCVRRKTRCASSIQMVLELIHAKVVPAENHSVYSTAKHKVNPSTLHTAEIHIPRSLFSQQASTVVRWGGCGERWIYRDRLEWFHKQISRAAFLPFGFVCVMATSSLQEGAISFSTFVCPTEIIAFSDRIQEFKAINTESNHQWWSANKATPCLLVVAISVDSQFTHLGTESRFAPISSRGSSDLFLSSLDQYSAWARWIGKGSNSAALRSHPSDLQRLRCVLTGCGTRIEVRAKCMVR